MNANISTDIVAPWTLAALLEEGGIRKKYIINCGTKGLEKDL